MRSPARYLAAVAVVALGCVVALVAVLVGAALAGVALLALLRL